MLEIHPRLLLYQGVIFLVFVFLMWRFVYRALVKLVEDRRRRVEQTIVDAEKARGEAEALRMGYESRVSELSARRDEVLRQAEADARRKHDEIVEQGRVEAGRIAARNRLQCESDVAEAMHAARAELLDISGSLARKALGKAATPEVEAELVKELSAEIRSTEWKS
jgi:F-type H+-transporting ATPase subunit b